VNDATRLLVRASSGDASAIDELAPVVYDELRRIAALRLRREKPGHTLQPTALANEAYLRLVDHAKLEWRDRAHFLALAARVMRQVLVDHARARDARKQGGGRERLTLHDAAQIAATPALDLLALEELAGLDARKGRVVEMRFFGGLEVREIAHSLGVSDAPVESDWCFSRAWLKGRLS